MKHSSEKSNTLIEQYCSLPEDQIKQQLVLVKQKDREINAQQSDLSIEWQKVEEARAILQAALVIKSGVLNQFLWTLDGYRLRALKEHQSKIPGYFNTCKAGQKLLYELWSNADYHSSLELGFCTLRTDDNEIKLLADSVAELGKAATKLGLAVDTSSAMEQIERNEKEARELKQLIADFNG